MKNFQVRLGIIAACIVATPLFSACSVTEDNPNSILKNDNDDSVVLENNGARPLDPEDTYSGGEIIDVNDVRSDYRELGFVKEFTARLENGRTVQCITWMHYDNAGGQSCVWEENGTVINSS